MNANRKPGNYPSVLITVSLTVALFLIGFCGWIALSSKELIKYVKQNVEVQVYLTDSINEGQLSSLKSKISQLGILADQTPESISYISKEKAAEIFFEKTQENFKDVLGNNPFKNALSLKLNEGAFDPLILAKKCAEIEKLEGVFEVDYAKDMVKGVSENANKAYIVLAGIVLIFLLASILLINNTIKLALYSQRFIIRTMQLVGATDNFIQKPFILKGAFQGLLAAIFASILIFIIQQIAVNQIVGLDYLQNYSYLAVLGGILLFLGPLIGMSSTFQSITRYLRMDLDELY